jgi:16S rRNA (cytosine1402-N4)-methyltransferase
VSLPPEEHVPVLASEVVEHLGPTLLAAGDAAVLVDCTIGLGGHSLFLLEQAPNARLIGLDVDETNLAMAQERLAGLGDRVHLVRANFGDLGAALDACGLPRVTAILADLGLSSRQIADPARGFSFDADGPLDMRLDQRQKTTAADLVNTLSEGELSDLLYFQSQERHSRRIAKRICLARRQGRINSTLVLARLVASAVGENPVSHRGRIHPATRAFMALRMSVNRETETLGRLLETMPGRLSPGGRAAVISFHSVEDRLVKTDFRDRAREGRYRIVTKKPIAAGEEERQRNPRSRSAKLRIAESVTSSISPETSGALDDGTS